MGFLKEFSRADWHGKYLKISVRMPLRVRRAEMFWRLALGKCAQAPPKRVGLRRWHKCYLSDLGTDVYIKGFQKRGLSCQMSVTDDAR
jgi:hypothetical protein